MKLKADATNSSVEADAESYSLPLYCIPLSQQLLNTDLLDTTNNISKDGSIFSGIYEVEQ